MKPREIAAALNDLVRICNDGAEGFRACTEITKIRSPKLNSMLVERAREYATAAEVLREQTRTFGETPATGTTVAGALHRGWLNVKATLAGNSDLTILEECERGESAALHTYEEALKQDLPLPVRTLVELQHQGILNSRDLIRKWREEEEQIRA